MAIDADVGMIKGNVVNLADRRKKSEPWECNYRMALTVQELIDKLAFFDRNARVYVRSGWIAGVIALEHRTNGAYEQSTVLLYMNGKELPEQCQ